MAKGEPVKLRLVLTAPPAGVMFALQGVGGVVEAATMCTGADLTFDLVLRVDLDGAAPRFLGDYARGGQEDRFFYFASGEQAGQPVVGGRRGKVALGAIPEALVREAVRTGGLLRAVTPGTDKRGGAACASVKAVWTLEDR